MIKNNYIYLLLFLSILLQCTTENNYNNRVSLNSPSQRVKSPPLDILVDRRAESIFIQLKLKKGYGIKKNAKNKITLQVPVNNFEYIGLEEIKRQVDANTIALLKPFMEYKAFTGVISSEDISYWNKLNSIRLITPTDTRNVPVIISFTLYYCSFIQNFCSIYKEKKVV